MVIILFDNASHNVFVCFVGSYFPLHMSHSKLVRASSVKAEWTVSAAQRATAAAASAARPVLRG